MHRRAARRRRTSGAIDRRRRRRARPCASPCARGPRARRPRRRALARPCAPRRRSPCRRAPTRGRGRARPAAGRAARRPLGSPGPAASRARRVPRAAPRGRPRAARATRPARSRPRRRPRRRRRATRPRASAGVARIAIDAQRHRRRLVVELEGGDRVVRRRSRRTGSARSNRDATCGSPIDSMSSPAGNGHSGPSRANARSAPFTKPRARAGREVHRLARPPRAAGSRRAVGTRRAAARRGPRARATSSGRDETFASRWSTARCMRTVPYTSSVTSPRSRALQGGFRATSRARGCARTRRLRCAAAPRARCDGPTAALSSTGYVPSTCASRRAARRATRARPSRACLRAGPRRARARRATVPSAAVVAPSAPGASGPIGVGRARAPHLHALAVRRRTTRPGRGLPARDDAREILGFAGAHGSRRNSSTVELVGVRRLALPAAPASPSAPTATARRAAQCRRRRGGRAARPRSRRARSRVRVHANTGPVSRPASIRMRHTPVSASPASIARSTGAAPRQRGSSEKCRFTKPCGSASSNETGSSWPNATTTPSAAPLARTSSTTSRAFSGVRTGEPELERGPLHRRRFGARAAPAAPVGLGDDERDSCPASTSARSGADRVGRRSEIDDASAPHRQSA